MRTQAWPRANRDSDDIVCYVLLAAGCECVNVYVCLSVCVCRAVNSLSSLIRWSQFVPRQDKTLSSSVTSQRHRPPLYVLLTHTDRQTHRHRHTQIDTHSDASKRHCPVMLCRAFMFLTTSCLFVVNQLLTIWEIWEIFRRLRPRSPITPPPRTDVSCHI